MDLEHIAQADPTGRIRLLRKEPLRDVDKAEARKQAFDRPTLQRAQKGRWLLDGDKYHEPALAVDRPPFEEMYRDYVGRIYAYVRAQVPTSADAEDITAQVFMNAYQAYERFEARNTTPAAWLFRIARNATLDHFRAGGRRERLRRTIEHQPAETEDPAHMAEERIQYRALLGHVAKLPERQRDAISFRHSGLSFEEVGVLMSCSEDAAKMLYHRALKALRVSVAAEGHAIE